MAEEQCILHWKATPSTEALIPCTTYAYEKVKDFCRSWKWTQSTQDVEVSHRFLAALPADFADEVPQLCFHRSCYARFTNKDRLQKAKMEAKRCAVPKPEPEIEPEVCFPNRCIFCGRECRSCRRKKEPGYKAEPLTRCRKPHVVARIQAKATELNDHELLAQVRGRDMIAEWAKYHETCYVTYVNKYHASTAPEAEWPAMDEEAFRHFVTEEVKPQVRNGRTCVLISAFTDLFNKTIKSSKHLKSELPLFELRKHCPFLQFTKEGSSASLPAAPPGPTSTQQKPQDPAGNGNQDRGQKRKRDGEVDSGHADMFRYAQSLHDKIGQVFAGSQEAPPPLELLNFLAACVSGSQLAPDAFTRLPNATRGKVTRIARNLVHLSAEGLDQRQCRTRAKTALAQSASPTDAVPRPGTAQSGGIEALAEEWLAMYGLL